MTKDDLKSLCEKKIAAQQAYEGWGMTNTFGKKPEELVEISLGYAKAQQDYLTASSNYETAIQQFSSTR